MNRPTTVALASVFSLAVVAGGVAVADAVSGGDPGGSAGAGQHVDERRPGDRQLPRCESDPVRSGKPCEIVRTYVKIDGKTPSNVPSIVERQRNTNR